MNMRKWQQLSRPALTKEHAAQRLQWALNHAHFTISDWQRVKWTDECTIERCWKGTNLGIFKTFGTALY
jgi:hypothetical protein